jgi:serine/threonine-protein kinase
MAMMAKRFSGPPAALRTLDAAIPSSIEHAVGRAMAIERDDRFATAAEFRAALAAPAGARTPTGANDEKSIAVLPFANTSADAESEYFSDGLTEEIINALVHLPGLHVAARTSSFAFKGKHMDIGEIGAKLKVATVLEGSVRRAGKRLRVTAQLIKVADGFHLWSERYDRELEDVFEIQDEIARAIAEQLTLKLATNADAVLVRPPTESMEAHELYLRGRHLLMRRGTGLALSAECFRRAIAADPGFAAPYAGLADSETLSAVYGYTNSAGAYERAHPAARRALELNDTLAESHMAYGLCETWLGWNFSQGEPEYRRASEINPSWSLPIAWLGVLLANVPGRAAESASLARRATQIEPLAPLIHGLAALTLFQLRLTDEAWKAAERTLELDPSLVLGLWIAGGVQQLRGQNDDAIRSLSRAVEQSERAPMSLAVLGAALAVTGRRDEALAVLQELVSRGADSQFAARVRWALGDHADALELFKRAVQERAAVFWTSHYPGQEGLAEDPRWHAILRSAGLDVLVSTSAPGQR